MNLAVKMCQMLRVNHRTAPTGEVIKTNLLLEYLEKLLYMDLENDPVAELAGGKVAMETKPPPLAAKRSKKTSLMLIVSQVFEKLAHFLGFELKYCLESLMLSLLSGYRFAPSSTDFKQQDEDDVENSADPEDEKRKEKYLHSCETLRQKTEEIERLQIEILKVLLCHDAFLPIQEFWSVIHVHWDLQMCFGSVGNSSMVCLKDAFMPIQEFWSDSREYWDLQRCGGSMGHLNRILGESEYPPTEMPSGNTLMEMLDGVMLLYNMNVLKENIQEFIQSYKDTMKKLDSCPIEMTEVRDELVRAKTVFIEKITEQARQICWIRAYMPEFYLEIVIHTHMALKNYFQTYVCFETLDEPCPSPKFQSLLADLLHSEPDLATSQKLVTKLLLSDAGFQLSAIEFMLGNHGDDKEQEAGATASPKKSKEKPFDFRNCLA
ncbi:RN123-like protein [Mya arenaria]|uniref:RN123-like protein n=1 Tax=Mya arenaria TaxID=6604 RepID=A0ABY7FW36_MYAAR|nr:RN123-like protein [Mya arenaria]